MFRDSAGIATAKRFLFYNRTSTIFNVSTNSRSLYALNWNANDENVNSNVSHEARGIEDFSIRYIVPEAKWYKWLIFPLNI